MQCISSLHFLVSCTVCAASPVWWCCSRDMEPTGGSPQEVRHPLPLPSFAIALYSVLCRMYLYWSPALPFLPLSILNRRLLSLLLYSLCVYLLVQDKTNEFYTQYISCSELSQLVRLIAEHLHGEDLQTILVIPAMMRGSVVELMVYVLIEMWILLCRNC